MLLQLSAELVVALKLLFFAGSLLRLCIDTFGCCCCCWTTAALLLVVAFPTATTSSSWTENLLTCNLTYPGFSELLPWTILFSTKNFVKMIFFQRKQRVVKTSFYFCLNNATFVFATHSSKQGFLTTKIHGTY